MSVYSVYTTEPELELMELGCQREGLVREDRVWRGKGGRDRGRGKLSLL